MAQAATGMQRYLDSVTIATPTRSVVANVTAAKVASGSEIKDLLVKQITAPVRWAETMATLKENDVTTIIEIGPGRVLAQLAKRGMQPQKSLNLDKLEDIEALVSIPA